MLGGLAAALAAPRLARAAPAERITLGFIGAGGIANSHIGPLLAQPDVQVIAVCDVNAQRRDALAARVNGTYGNADCGAYRDFRELLARPDLDAVLIATPDNWHALQAIAAARAGKHIYSEKPFARTIAEGRAMVEAIARHGVVFQHGTQQRSDGNFRLACELVRAGRLGRLRRVHVAVPGGVRGTRGSRQPVPDWFDYDLWLGPAPEAPYSPERVDSGHWYHMQDYSAGGFVSGWGVHHVDIAQWALGTEQTGPTEIEGSAVFPSDGLCDAPLTWHVEYHGGDGPTVVFTSENEGPNGVRFDGDDGTLFVTRGALTAEPADVLVEPDIPRAARLYRSLDHHRNWLDCIRTGDATVAPPEIAHRSQSICCLADIALRLGRRLRWDSLAEQFLDDPQADRLLSREMRAPWSL